MGFRAIKLGFTPFSHEIYYLKIENGVIQGKYGGKVFNRKGYFFGSPGYVLAGLASIETEGKDEEDFSRDFSYKMDEIKINEIKIKARKGNVIWKVANRVNI